MENGFPAYKIHPGSLAADDVAEMAALVRRRVGDGYHLMLDPNCGYDFATALRVGGALDARISTGARTRCPIMRSMGFES